MAMAQKSASSSRLDSLRGMLPRTRRHARRGLALFLTWVLVFQAIYGANTTEAIAEGLDAGEPKSALAKRLAKQFGIPKSEVYDKLV